MKKRTAKKRPAPKRAMPATKKRARDEEPMITKFGRSVMARPKRPPMIPNGDGSWREYEPLAKGTRVQVAPDMLVGIVESHTTDGIPMVRVAEMIDGALTGAMLKARPIEPMLIVVNWSKSQDEHVPSTMSSPLAIPRGGYDSGASGDATTGRRSSERRTRAEKASASPMISVEMVSNPIVGDDPWSNGNPYACSICSVARDDANASAGSASLCSTLKEEDGKPRVVFAWFCPVHASLTNGLRDRIVADRIDTIVGWTTLFAAAWASLPKADVMRSLASPSSTMPDYDPSDRVDCSHQVCKRWLVGKLLLGWFVYTDEQGKTRAFCHTHSKDGRIEFDRMSARVSPSARLRRTATEVAKQLEDRLGPNLDPSGLMVQGATKVHNAIVDSVSVAYDQTIAAIDGAIARASDTMLSPLHDDVERAVEIVAANKGASTRPGRKKRGQSTDGSTASKSYPCCIDGCDTTYFASALATPTGIKALGNVPDPPEGWGVVEENGDGMPWEGEHARHEVFVRLAYCPAHVSIAVARHESAMRKADALAARGFEPDLDDGAPWDSPPEPDDNDDPPFPSLLQVDASESIVEENAPWE